jgi:hypothetical protein
MIKNGSVIITNKKYFNKHISKLFIGFISNKNSFKILKETLNKPTTFEKNIITNIKKNKLNNELKNFNKNKNLIKNKQKEKLIINNILHSVNNNIQNLFRESLNDIISEGGNINNIIIDDESLLTIIINENNTNFLDILLNEYNIDVNNTIYLNRFTKVTPLYLTINNKNENMFNKLLSIVNINTYNQVLLELFFKIYNRINNNTYLVKKNNFKKIFDSYNYFIKRILKNFTNSINLKNKKSLIRPLHEKLFKYYIELLNNTKKEINL